jgi:hypothetical protein
VGAAMKAAGTPVLASRIVAGLVAEPGYRDAILGDLEEEFADRCERVGIAEARSWYWSQTLLAIVPLARSRPWSFVAGMRLLATVTVTYLLVLEAIRVESIAALRFTPVNAPVAVRVVLLCCIAFAGLIAGRIIVRIVPREPVMGGLLLVSITLGVGAYHVGTGNEAEAIFRGAKVVTLMCTMGIGSLLTLGRHSRNS